MYTDDIEKGTVFDMLVNHFLPTNTTLKSLFVFKGLIKKFFAPGGVVNTTQCTQQCTQNSIDKDNCFIFLQVLVTDK